MKALLVAFVALTAVSAHAHEGHDKLLSEWSLSDVQQLPPATADQPAKFECPKSLKLTDEDTKLSFASTDPDMNAPKSKFPVFADVNQPVKCTEVDSGKPPLKSCHIATRPLNGDVWALSDVTCQTRKSDACTVPDVRWTVTARPGQLYVRMDCRNCATVITMGQCIYAFVKGDIRHADGPREGSEEGHHHHGGGGNPDDADQ